MADVAVTNTGEGQLSDQKKKEGAHTSSHEAFEKKLADQEKILKEDSPDKVGEEDHDLLDEYGNFDKLGAKIKSTLSYKFNT